MTKPLQFGLIGCGAMGAVIARHLMDHWSGKASWVGFCDSYGPAARKLAKKLDVKVPSLSLGALLEKSDWVVEAASPDAVPELLKLCLAKKKNVLVMSSGGLLQCARLLKQAEKVGVRVLVPSGAIAGLDAIKAACLGKIEFVQITTRKSPLSLAGAPYFKEKKMDIANLKSETTVFEGNAAEAVLGFPANVNVAATLALVSGMGPLKTRVKIIADPGATRNIHQIVVRGSSGTIATIVENVPSEVNPKTSALAVLAACAALDGIFTTVRVGT